MVRVSTVSCGPNSVGQPAHRRNHEAAGPGPARARLGIVLRDLLQSLLLANLGFWRFTLAYTPVWNYMERAFDEAMEVQRDRLERLGAAARISPGAHPPVHPAQPHGAAPLPGRLPAHAGGDAHGPGSLARTDPDPAPPERIATYAGEALHELREGADLVLNVAPNGCMVATMGEALTPAILAGAGGEGRIQHLFSADGDVNEELLTLALLKAMGPERYYRAGRAGGAAAQPYAIFISGPGCIPALPS